MYFSHLVRQTCYQNSYQAYEHISPMQVYGRQDVYTIGTYIVFTSHRIMWIMTDYLIYVGKKSNESSESVAFVFPHYSFVNIGLILSVVSLQCVSMVKRQLTMLLDFFNQFVILFLLWMFFLLVIYLWLWLSN